MTLTALDAALAAANPLSDRDALDLRLHAAEMELVEEIVSIPVSPHLRDDQTERSRPVAGPARRLALILGAFAAIAAAAIIVWSAGGGNGPTPAFAAPLVRFARATPLALLRLPGWRVSYADEEPGGSGELDFVRGPAGADGLPRGATGLSERPLVGRYATLTWSRPNAAARRYALAGHEHLATGLGVTVHRLVREGIGHGWLDVSAYMLDAGRELSFRATVTSMAMFARDLRALDAVGVSTWLRAMPPSVIKSADSGEVVRQMLKGIPLPPGFDAVRIRGAHLVHDRYQLGAAVTGTVACMWFADWNRARHAGDTAVVKRAVAAMATSPRWPILRQMAHQGGWTQVLTGYARSMRTGDWHGRPLIPELNDGLGCGPSWGINLSP